MNIYYNMKSQTRCNEQGIRLSGDFPSICFKQQPEWTINLLDENGKPYDLSGINAFRAAVDVDFSHATDPIIRTLDDNIDQSQKENGILKVFLNANTVNFQQAVDNAINKKAYFELWGLDQNANTKLYVLFEIRISSVVDPDGGELPEEVPSDYMTVTQVQAIFRAADELQFTSDTADDSAAHADQADSDTHFRYRNSAAGGEWSPWIKLPVGVKGDRGTNGISVSNIEQTTTSTASSGTNVITVTLSDGMQKSFNVWNGAKGEQGIQGVKGDTGEAFHFDAIGTLSEKDQYNDEPMGFAYLDTENGNIYIKNSDTSADWTNPIPFRGEQGVSITKVEQTTTSTASEGTNVITVTLSDGQTFTFNVKNGATGKTGDKGDQGDQGVQGPAGVNGLTPHIGENKNWWIGTEDTGVLAEGSNQFTNGVPPYEFTNSDLSSGILSRTFAELGVDSSMPVSVNIISGNGVVMDGDVRLALIWTDTGLKVDLSQLGTISGTWKLVFAGGTKVTGGGGTGSGNGYTRTIVSSDSTVQTGYWYTCTSAITLTLPAGSIGAYVRISTDYNTTGVIVATTNGETIDGDAEGFTLDKTSGTVEVLWNGSGWTVIEAK